MMSNRRKTLSSAAVLIILVFIAWVAPGQTGAQTIDHEIRGGWQLGPEAYHPSRVIVRFADTISTNAAVDSIQHLGYSLHRIADFKATAAFPSGVRIGIVELPESETPDAAVARLNAAPGILYAERDYMRYKYDVPWDVPVIPNDPEFVKMWGLHNENCQFKDPRMPGNPVDDADIDAPEAWRYFTGSEEMIVAVIDTGCYIYHPDLADNIWVNEAEINGEPGVDDDGNGYIDDIHGWDFFHDDNTLWHPNERDEYGYLVDEHGTHCAGTIGARGNNNMGVTGVNWNVEIMPLKFIGPEGGYSSDAILAIEYAANNGAKVANCSWGGGGYDKSLKDAIEASGMLVVCAAGNTGQNNDVNPHYPSGYDSENIIAVAAMMQNEMPCDYPGWWSTCYGATTVDLFAPGGYILSTVPPNVPVPTPSEQYGYLYGSSMATPHVSGAAALISGLYSDIPLYRMAGMGEDELTIKDMILDNVDVFPQYEGLVLTGGRLNVAKALTCGGVPIITSIEASPRWGSPPLEVSFSGEAISHESQIVDKWWDFGDNSPTVHEWEATHTYTEEGLYTASFHVIDDRGIEVTGAVQIDVSFQPTIAVEPAEIHTRVKWGETCEETITISNIGDADLDYMAEVQLLGLVNTSGAVTPIQKFGTGGPDEHGYFWLDSDEPGVLVPEWFDISEIGAEITLGADDSVAVDLPFEFPFYGETKSSVRISSNGYLTFGDTGAAWDNSRIPSTQEPNDLIAIFWDDLAPNKDNGKVFYYGDDQKFVVQYQDVPRYYNGGPYTFQATLTPDGTITYLYKTMLGASLDKSTIGIENADGTIGLQVAYKEEYVHDNLGVFFAPGWVRLDKTSGTLAPGESDMLTVAFAAYNLPQGTWKATIEIKSNDPAAPQVDIDTFMFAKSMIPPVVTSISAHPWAGSAPLTVQFSAVVEDIDGEVVEAEWDFGDGSDPITGTLMPMHTYEDYGEYTATLTITDDDDLTAAGSIVIRVEDLPKVATTPTAFNRAIRAHRSQSDKLTVTNVGNSTLVFAADAVTVDTSESVSDGIVPLGAGGPDGFGYRWIDSDEPGGPQFEWVEISELGTKLNLYGDDSKVLDLPFTFPFYGDEKNTVRVSSEGYLTFGTKGSVYMNTEIPDPKEPNDLLAVYWDDLTPPQAPPDGGVFYYHDEANDRFIVEWKKLPRYRLQGSYTFEAILYPDGTIVYQYLDMQFGGNYASKGTIGIENAEGTDGLQVLYNTAGYVHDGLAIKFQKFQWLDIEPKEGRLEPGESMDLDVLFDLGSVSSGVLSGAVAIESNDIREPQVEVPVIIEVIPNSPPVISSCGVNPEMGLAGTEFQFVASAHDPDGTITDKWWDFGDGSSPVHDFVATHTYSEEGKHLATFVAVDNDGYKSIAEVEVLVQESPSASWNPKQLDFYLATNQTVSKVVTLSNAGPGTLLFGSEKRPYAVRTPERVIAPEDIRDHDAMTAAGIYGPNPHPERSPWLPDNVGTILKTWRCPDPIAGPWGVGVLRNSGNIVIGDGTVDPTVDYVVTEDGVYTGRSWSADFGGTWAGDITFDGEYIWQVNVGGDNAIYKIDPETGEIVGSLFDPSWSYISQRGLAYNPNDDTFYTGGWNTGMIYKIKGESWDRPGEIIDEWWMDVGTAGLAYHPIADILIISANTNPDTIYFIDPNNHEFIASFPNPIGGDHEGVGCDLAPDGNLWVGSFDSNMMCLVETGLGPVVADWLTWEPVDGSVPAGGSVDIAVTADASELDPGVHSASLLLLTNDTEYPMIIVPIKATVAVPPRITEATAEPRLGEPPLEVTFHANFTAPEIPVVSYGWDFGDGTSSSELDVTHTYAEPGNYTAVFTVIDEYGAQDRVAIDIEVRLLPRATCEPEVIEVTLPPRGSLTETVTIGNVNGNADLEFRARVRHGAAPVIAMPERIGYVIDDNAKTAAGLYGAIDRQIAEKIAASVQPGAVGDVILSWQVPEGIDIPWGLGFDGNVWIGDPLVKKDHIVTPEGIHTGRIIETPWVGAWPADMAYDANRDLMWQVNVGGDNGIYGLDPETGEVVDKIVSLPWSSISQRGLAHDAMTDTFYIGGWNEDVIYHIKGSSWDSPGEVIGAWLFPVGISGLAWHPDGILWVANNGDPDMIFGIDLEASAVIYQFPSPSTISHSGAGLGLNDDGNLWVADMGSKRIHLVNTGMPHTPGITVDPMTGVVESGETAELDVMINAATLGKPGDEVRKYIEVTTNDPVAGALFVDLIVHIEAGPSIVEATATPAIGEPPLTVKFDALVEPGATDVVDVWWDFGDGTDLVHEATAEHVYTELGEYEASVHAIDENEVEASAKVTVTVKWLPVLRVEPEEFDEIVPVGEEKQTILTISNTGVAPMDFEISVSANPDKELVSERPETIGIEEIGSIIRVNPMSGYLVPGGSQDVILTLGSPEIAYGTHSFYLCVTSNDPHYPLIAIPVTLKINAPPVVEITEPEGGDELHCETEIRWNATDPDDDADELLIDLAWTRDGETWHELGTGLANTGSFEWNTIEVGEAGNTFRVRARATDPAGAYHEFVTEEFTIINNAPAVDFDFTPSPATRRDKVKFVDKSTDDGRIVAWHWEFGDETTSDAQNPEHQYAQKGEFDVKLTVTDNGGLTGTVTKTIQVGNAAPIAAFSFTPSPAKVGEVVRFTNESTDDGEIAECLWQFGDGTFSDTVHPEHVYSEAGTFTVKLIVIDDDSVASSVEHEIEVISSELIAAFSFTPSRPTIYDTVRFTDESTHDGEIIAWHWEFGDGAESYEASPEHQYSERGTFTVRLTVTDDRNETDNAQQEIEIVNAPPQAAFTFAPSPATVETIVRFTDETLDDGEIVAWHWEFGDGAESYEASPEHQYAEKGVFTVKLTVTDDGDIADTAEETIEIVNIPPEVEIVRPTAGQVLTGEAMIEWEAVDPDDDADKLKITLEYEPASGGDWQIIASDVPNTGKYIWDTSKLERGGKYRIRIIAVDPQDACGEAISEEFTVIALTRMVIAAPNPVNDLVTFYYDIDTDGELFVYDVAGRLVHTAKLSATANSHEWNLTTGGRPVASGLYLYVVVTDDAERSEVGRLVVERL